MSERQIQYGIRLPKTVLTRLDKIADRMSKDGGRVTRGAGARVTRADVLRLAITHGMDWLEKERAT